MIGAQPDLRQVGEQHIKIDIPRQQAQQLTRLRMAFASAEADIHLAADDGVQGVVVPVAQTNQCLRVALIDALGEGVKQDHQQRRFRRQLELEAARHGVVRFIEDLVAHLHPVRQILLHAADQRCRRQAQRRFDKQRIVKPGAQLGQRLAHRRGRNVHPLRRTGDAELLGQELQAEQ